MTTEDEILELVGYTPVSAAELVERYRMDRTPATVNRHLRALHERGELARSWDGNAQFGRYVYSRTEPAAVAG